MGGKNKFNHFHHGFKVLNDYQWQRLPRPYIEGNALQRKSRMEPRSHHRVSPVKLDTIIFMPNESTKASRDSHPSAHRRNLRSNRRATANRPVPSSTNPTGMSDQRRSSAGNRQYMFIDQDAARNTSNEAIRVHVMRESHRARRQLRGLMQNNESHGQMTIFSSAPPSPRPARRAGLERLESHSSSERQSPRAETEDEQTLQAPQSIDKQQLKTLAQERLTAVLTTTSPAISSASQSFRFLDSLPPNIIDLCDEDAGALHALLALVTSVQASVSTLQAAEYESSALEILRARLAESSSADHSDETIITVLLLSRLERSRMNEETAGFHEAALMRMIRDRGGLESLESSNEALVRLLREYGLCQDVGTSTRSTARD